MTVEAMISILGKLMNSRYSMCDYDMDSFNCDL